MKLLLLCTFLTGLVGLVFGDAENARLLASKTLLNQYLVEDKDVTVEYDIYNIGGRHVTLQVFDSEELPLQEVYKVYQIVVGRVGFYFKLYGMPLYSALNTELRDQSFPDTDFDVIHGSLSVQWQRIGPGSNVSHVVILKPKKSGYFNFTSAEISYLPSESATERQLGYTSAPGEGGIVNFKDYDRKFSPHVLDWVAFAVMTLPSLGIPFLLWHGSKSKYEPKPKKS